MLVKILEGFDWFDNESLYRLIIGFGTFWESGVEIGDKWLESIEIEWWCYQLKS